MTQWAPMDPFSPDDRDGIPAADPGPGAPPPAPGYGADTVEAGAPEGGAPEDAAPEDAAGPVADDGQDPPFRTPDPGDVSRR